MILTNRPLLGLEWFGSHRGLSWFGIFRRRIATAVTAGLLVAPLAAPAAALANDYDPATDPNSMASTAAYTGATSWWNAGYTGAGIDIAVIDTGVSPVPGLDTPGKVIYGPDLSLESQAPNLRNLDTNGHGTFMAGLMAGKDSTLTTPYANAPASAYRGIAPDARIVSIKVGVADGGVDVSQVIAAINWVIQHRNDNGLNIRIINLSYGTNSTQAATVDPLAYAAEQAWKKGIVVVAAAGNSGYQKGSAAPGLANPAYNDYVIGVGGYDTMGTASYNDDNVGAYSAGSERCGAACKKPNFVAVGSHLQGLRVPNSYIDVNHPEGLLGDRYFRGSGTSQAAAITSGTIALILQKHPTLTPDRVKRFIADYARKVPAYDSHVQGAGEINLGLMISKPPSNTIQSFTNGTGIGSLEAARGSDHLTDDGVLLSGEIDIFGAAYNAAAMAVAMAAENSWSGGTWNGNTWSGNTWSGNSWSGNTWSGNSWSGNSWSGNTWSGNTWSGNSWSGNTWSGNSWSGNTWSGNTWSADVWG